MIKNTRNNSSNKSTVAALPALTSADNNLNAITGCVSKISLPSKNTQAYFAALKSYSKLTSMNPAVSDSINADVIPSVSNEVVETEEHRTLGMLGCGALPKNNFSGDEISGCGYLGWLSI